MTAADVFRQAEELKVAAQDTSRGANEAWMSRQALQDVYQKLLVMDLEFALDKKVEQELWNHAFKNQISTLQNQAKDKQNQKRGEIQASLNLFLETASGFYLQLLQELCSTFKLDLPFRKKASYFGIIKEYGPVSLKIKLPKKTSCMYICQHCLVHLGDIARYRQQIDQAQAYYRHAARLVPYNGQPYNQLAILEAAKGNKLSTVFYYIRSIAVKHPFPVASTNLEKLYSKMSKDSHDTRQKLTAADVTTLFLQLHSFVYLCINLTKAKSHVEKIISNLQANITSVSFSSYQLVQMIALNLYTLHHVKRKLGDCRGSGEPGDETCRNRSSESSIDVSSESVEHVNGNHQEAYELMFGFIVFFLEVLLQTARRQESKARDSPVLAPLKVILDWLRSDPSALSDPAFSTPLIWTKLCKVLNYIQVEKELSSELQAYVKTPLPEDCDLECFLPVNKALSELDFSLTPSAGSMSEEIETGLRCQRIVAAGYWIAEEFPSLNLLNVQRLPSGRLDFSTQMQMSSEDGESPSELKVNHHNVAIQAKLQKGKGQLTTHVENKSVENGVQKAQVKMIKKDLEVINASPEKHDAGIMTSSNGTSEFDTTQKRVQQREQDVDHPSVGFNMVPPFMQPAVFPCPPPSGEASFVPTRSMLPGVYGLPPPANIRLADMSMVANQTISGQDGNFESFTRIYQAPPTAVSPGSPMMGANYFPVGQPVGYPRARLPQPVFIKNADGLSHMSAPVTISSQPWPPSSAPLTGNQYNPIRMAGNVITSGDGLSKKLFRPVDQMSCGSPDLEFKDSFRQVDSPNQLFDVGFRRFSGSPVHLVPDPNDPQLAASLSSQGASSPFSRSPTVDAVQLSRSLPNSVRSGGQPPYGSTMTTGLLVGGSSAAVAADAEKISSPFSQFFPANPAINLFSSDDAVMKGLSYNDSVPLSPYRKPLSAFNAVIGSGCENSPAVGSSSFSPSTSSNSLFTTSLDERVEPQLPAANTYTLFSQSPWPLGISSSQAGDTSSHRSSPFGSSNSGSLRATPDPFSSEERSGTSGRSLGGPWHTSNSMVVDSSISSLRTSANAESEGASLSNIQSLWTSGPSPLQKLLDQQKQQRQLNPR